MYNRVPIRSLHTSYLGCKPKIIQVLPVASLNETTGERWLWLIVVHPWDQENHLPDQQFFLASRVFQQKRASRSQYCPQVWDEKNRLQTKKRKSRQIMFQITMKSPFLLGKNFHLSSSNDHFSCFNPPGGHQRLHLVAERSFQPPKAWRLWHCHWMIIEWLWPNCPADIFWMNCAKIIFKKGIFHDGLW